MTQVRRTSHAVYHIYYHFVWVPKYRKKILKGDYALFNMDGEITFSTLGETVIIRFTPGLRESLPELKK